MRHTSFLSKPFPVASKAVKLTVCLGAAMAACRSLLVPLLLTTGLVAPIGVRAKLTADVSPSNSSTNGSDWCDPLRPCNVTKPNSAEIESAFGLGLLSKSTSASSSYQYADVSPAAAVDWRTVLSNWTVRDQGTCGECKHVLRTYSIYPTTVFAILGQ